MVNVKSYFSYYENVYAHETSISQSDKTNTERSLDAFCIFEGLQLCYVTSWILTEHRSPEAVTKEFN